MGRPGRIEVRVPHYCNSLDDDRFLLRRCNIIEPIDVVTRADGIRVVSPPRLAFDLAADLRDLELESVIEQIIDRKWCTVDTIIPARPPLVPPGSTRRDGGGAGDQATTRSA